MRGGTAVADRGGDGAPERAKEKRQELTEEAVQGRLL